MYFFPLNFMFLLYCLLCFFNIQLSNFCQLLSCDAPLLRRISSIKAEGCLAYLSESIKLYAFSVFARRFISARSSLLDRIESPLLTLSKYTSKRCQTTSCVREQIGPPLVFCWYKYLFSSVLPHNQKYLPNK